ncbi:4Fe-4S binding protein [Methanothermococcus sp.]|uniref:4Fe-4S binding protein n=1 Tax=Methanothermococcus sp. TaxID=2614238 RepID=UPI0025FF9BFF|nr:4Fe-4S binding protein [Methanothermococcus sp.]
MLSKTISAKKVIKRHFGDLDVELSLDDKIVKKRIDIDSKKCLSCNICVEVCPINIIKSNTPYHPKISKEDCVYCSTCVNACPVNAIEIFHIVGRVFKGNVIIERWNRNEKLIYNRSKCVSCLVCMKNCPFCAINKSKEVIEFDMEKCRLCGYCGYLCPSNAIDFEGI